MRHCDTGVDILLGQGKDSLLSIVAGIERQQRTGLETSTALRSGCRQVHRIPEGNAGKVFQYVVMISMLQSGFQLICGRTGLLIHAFKA